MPGDFFVLARWGRVSDRVGRRPVLLGSVALIIVGYLAFAQATTLQVFFYRQNDFRNRRSKLRGCAGSHR